MVRISWILYLPSIASLILLGISVLWVSRLKRHALRYYGLHLVNIMEHKLIRLQWYFAAIFILLTLASAWQKGHLDSLLGAIGTLYKENNEISAIMLGSFIASVFGICTERFQRKSKMKRQIRRSSTLLLLDLESCLQELQIFRMTQPLSLSGMQTKRVMSYAENWRDYYVNIASEWDARYHRKLASIYEALRDYNQAIRQNNIDEAAQIVQGMFSTDDMRQIGTPITTTEDVVKALKLLSNGKRVANLDLWHCLNELHYVTKFTRNRSLVEQRLVDMLSPTESMSWELVAAEMKVWAKGQPRLRKLQHRIERITWEVLLESPKLQMVWNECSLRRDP